MGNLFNRDKGLNRSDQYIFMYGINSECIIFETRVDLPYCIVSLTALFFLILLRSTLVRSAFNKVFFTSRLYAKGCSAPKLNECLVETLFKCI